MPFALAVVVSAAIVGCGGATTSVHGTAPVGHTTPTATSTQATAQPALATPGSPGGPASGYKLIFLYGITPEGPNAIPQENAVQFSCTLLDGNPTPDSFIAVGAPSTGYQYTCVGSQATEVYVIAQMRQPGSPRDILVLDDLAGNEDICNATSTGTWECGKLLIVPATQPAPTPTAATIAEPLSAAGISPGTRFACIPLNFPQTDAAHLRVPQCPSGLAIVDNAFTPFQHHGHTVCWEIELDGAGSPGYRTELFTCDWQSVPEGA